MLSVFSCAFSPSLLVSFGVINYHEFGGFRRENYSLTVLEPSWLKSVSLSQNQSAVRALLPPEAVGENPVPSLSQHSEQHSLYSLIYSLSFHCQGQWGSTDSLWLCYCHMTFLSSWSQSILCLPLIKNMWLHLGPIWFIQDNLPISNSLITPAKSF